MKVIGIIPARLQSSRLPHKALVDIEGLPMIIHVMKRAALSTALDTVYVATDSEEIRSVVEQHGGHVIMTSSSHQTGTDRIAEAAQHIDADVVVNIQGDEPLLCPSHIDAVVDVLKSDQEVSVAFLVTSYDKKKSPSDIKAVLDVHNNILYCSRADIPSNARSPVLTMWKMCFIVPFRKAFLLEYTSWEQTPLEKIEYNEYLRILEHGYAMKAVPVNRAHISVDTEEDLIEVRKLMKKDIVKKEYI